MMDLTEHLIELLLGSTGCSLNGALARADAALWQTPYQSDPDLQEFINSRSFATRQIRSVPAHVSTEADWQY